MGFVQGEKSSICNTLSTTLLSLAFVESFHRDLFKMSMYSCSVNSRCDCVRDVTSIASIQDTARFCCCGRSMYCGHVGHSSGIWSGVVVRICATFFFVQCHVSLAFPQVMIRWTVVSGSWQFRHLFVGDNRMLWSRSCVGSMSCITLYHYDLYLSGTGALCRFLHTVFHCMSGRWRTMRMS